MSGRENRHIVNKVYAGRKMQFFGFTKRSLVELPKFRDKFTLRGIGRGLARPVALAALYLAISNGTQSWPNWHPLVMAWIATTALFLPSILREVAPNLDIVQRILVVGAIFAIIVFCLLLWLDHPIWIKRAVSVVAALEILMFLVSIFAIEKLRRPDWDTELFMKGQMYQGPNAIAVLLVNEIAIWSADDWLWIASRMFLVLIAPIIYVAVTHTVYR